MVVDKSRQGGRRKQQGRTETSLPSTSFLKIPIGGIDGVSHAMIETTYRPSPTKRNTSTHTHPRAVGSSASCSDNCRFQVPRSAHSSLAVLLFFSMRSARERV